MSQQTFETHVRWVPLYHFVLLTILLGALTGGVVNLVRALGRGSGRIEAATVLLLVVASAILFWYVRVFPLKAQDRAIRAEENLRHYVLTGGLLDPRLSVPQIVALRFAPDEELPALAKRAVAEELSQEAIKRQIEVWKADLYRV
jgi:hypothetical protein